jgi:uncharacterized protein
MTLFVSELWHYPLKSARGEQLSLAVWSALGLAEDRRWVLVDDQARFVSQRSCAVMGGLLAHAQGTQLTLVWQGQSVLADACPDQVIDVEVWGDRVEGYGVAQAVNQQLSAWLGQSVRLVYCPDHAQRIVDPKYAGEGHLTAFSDGFPILVITQASLDELSRLWGSPVDVRRFRPNIVIGGDCAPFAEDAWQQIQIGEVILDLVKPCSRCVIPSLDPDTQTSTAGFARFLASTRRRDDGKVYLGQNAIVHSALAATPRLVQTSCGQITEQGKALSFTRGQAVQVLR